MFMNLVVVESPTKAKTLTRFLGKDYVVEATMGHLKDLPKTKLNVDIENDFEPCYSEIPGKEKQINIIKREARGAKTIYLATDPDREGEAISSHVKEIVGNGKTKRIVFHEITREAIETALKNPREVDTNLVSAQIARRVLDRLVGYKLSPLLWKKVRRGLSAGRVQSVTVRLIVEREREIESFKPVEYWEICLELQTIKDPRRQLTVQLVKIGDKKAEIHDSETAEKLIADLNDSTYVVSRVDTKEVKKNPYPPFTTSTMTQSAARLFGWSSKKTMSVAQKLYEKGHITYHRTDSVNLADSALGAVRNLIVQDYGDPYLPDKPRFYKRQSKLAQEAHEAIRPTNVSVKSVDEDKYSLGAAKLYELIWKRFVACQMTASLYDQTTIDVGATKNNENGTVNYLLRVGGQSMKFNGWRVIFGGKDPNETEVDLPSVKVEEPLELIKIVPSQKFTTPQARYNEASLIKTLEKLGIGRPSTYAPTISTIQMRGYVEKNDGKFSPTSVGLAVNDFLVVNFPIELEYAFTAKMEDNLDSVAKGNLEWRGMMHDFWEPFSKKLKDVEEKSARVKIATEKVGRACPECKQGELVIRSGRFGKFISCSRFPECKYTEKLVNKAGMKCPDCKNGDVIVKKTKKGRKFFGCSRYPGCKWASWQIPKTQS